MTLLFPGLLLLLVPMLFALFWRGRTTLVGAIVRVTIAALLALLAAVPLARIGGKGVDVIVVVDLSRSMPADGRARALEIVKLLDERRTAGDRVGVVTFGREARVERLRRAGYNAGFTPLEAAVGHYVTGYLDRDDRYR